MKRIFWWSLVFLVIGILTASLLFIRVTVTPPGETRVILDHNQHVYIAPPCFNHVKASNFLTEETLQEALAKDYQPEQTCTQSLMQPQSERLIIAWLQQGKWNRDGSWNIQTIP